ncbi:hypothetical protein FA13DRAFT_1515668 [Coprinellus micaceus]|uniref:DUF6534 domain-containing protein n=1 Tax=Coprinellus micaceus TaxID=71717 RepID=A0A4Y7SMD4_COPMI|nr:hypothetical protein FA13DRAFT_1515668 [Coprinellus micaceus]
MPATLDYGVALDNTMGAMFIGVLISGVLHGICLLQAFFYFTNYRNDHWLLKSMVGTTILFDAIHLCFVSHSMYHYLVSNWGDENELKRLVWSVLMEALLTGLNAGIVQAFYAFRVWTLSKRNWFLTITILVFIFAEAGCGVAWVAISMGFETYTDLLRINPLTITINALSTAVDVFIAVSMCWLLHGSRTGFRRSDTIITNLMIFVVNTGMLTSLCAIASLTSLVASPRTLIYATFYFCIGRFYTNSFLATLNARKTISSAANTEVSSSGGGVMMSLPGARSGMSGTGSKGRTPQDITIRIETTKSAMDDRNEARKTPLV